MSDRRTTGSVERTIRFSRAFTLIELLVVIGVIAILLAVLVPSLRKARHQARVVVCASNLRNTGTAIHAYAQDYDDTIPFGPEGLPMAGSQFYTATGNVTSLISLYDGSPVGLGLLLDGYLSEQPKVLFCPGADQHTDAEVELSRVGKLQAQCDYYYRHASVAMLYGEPTEFHIRLTDLGKNRNGNRISALVMDVQFLANESLSVFGVMTRTNHNRQVVNILLADGQVIRQDNSNGRYTVDIGGYPYDALDKILEAFELADELR
ncbi:MAG: type II secretion system protein [Planctomycetota bacterium]|jgi:prepilin-type N-terminal cleavage/methylation domain-containing protein